MCSIVYLYINSNKLHHIIYISSSDSNSAKYSPETAVFFSGRLEKGFRSEVSSEAFFRASMAPTISHDSLFFKDLQKQCYKTCLLIAAKQVVSYVVCSIRLHKNMFVLLSPPPHSHPTCLAHLLHSASSYDLSLVCLVNSLWQKLFR